MQGTTRTLRMAFWKSSVVASPLFGFYMLTTIPVISEAAQDGRLSAGDISTVLSICIIGNGLIALLLGSLRGAIWFMRKKAPS